MNRSLIISSGLHVALIILTALSLPFLAKKPIDLPPIISVELIQITEKTNIPFAPKAKKIIEKVKEKEKQLVSEQAPPKKIEKTKTKTVVSIDQNNETIEQAVASNLSYIKSETLTNELLFKEKLESGTEIEFDDLKTLILISK